MVSKRLWIRVMVVAGTQLVAALLACAWLVGYGGLLAQAAEPPVSLLVYNTVERLLDGDLLHTVTMDEVRSDLAAFPPDWPVVGVGTTDWIERSGEMMPDGLAGSIRFWWADPGYGEPPGYLYNLAREGPPGGEFPFLGLSVGDPSMVQTWPLRDVPDVHAWLEQQLAGNSIDLAGVQLSGEFGPVQTSVAYNLPLTGLDLSGGYVGEDYFRFADYITATWTLDGLYAAEPKLQPVISTAGHPLHLHGYQPDVMRGGHVKHASAISATVTIWPLSRVQARTVELDTLRLLDDLARIPGPDLDEEPIADYVADLLTGWGIDTTVNEEGQWVVGHLPGTGPRVALVAYLDKGDIATFVGVPPDSRVGSALILSLARRFSALPPEERADLYIVGWTREEHPDLSGRLSIPAIADADLVIVVDDSASAFYPTLGNGPVVVWHEDTTPEWVMETVSTGHIMEQYLLAQRAGVNVALPSLLPVELMMAH